MSERDRKEPLQPDPMLREGRLKHGRALLIVLAAIVVIVVLYGLSQGGRFGTAEAPAPPLTTGSSATTGAQTPPPLETPPAGGRNSADVPRTLPNATSVPGRTPLAPQTPAGQ